MSNRNRDRVLPSHASTEQPEDPDENIVKRDGQRQDITGWRVWAIAIPAILVAAIVIVAAIVLVLGLTLTVGAVLIIAVPTAVILALIARALMSRDAGGGSSRQA